MTERIAETLLALCLFLAAMTAIRDLSYSMECQIAAYATGSVLILLLQLFSGNSRISERLRGLCYFIGLACFVVFFRYVAQGFLYSVNVFLVLWGSRFSVEVRQLSVSTAAATGSLVLWSLLGLSCAMLILTQIQKRAMAVLFLLEFSALAFGSVLGVSDLWSAVLLLLMAVLGILVFYGAPRRKDGLRSGICVLLVAGLIGGMLYVASGYQKSAAIEEGKQAMGDAFETLRYGADTLPQGDLKEASKLLDGDLTKERLVLQMEKPQELYLRGFVGAVYTGRRWEGLPLADYQGEYAGMLDWLGQKSFQPVSQYAVYEKLTDEAQGYQTTNTRITVENTGANRKYVYLPAAVSSWDASGTKVWRDENVKSTALFGAGSYTFDMSEQVQTAEQVYPASWTEHGGSETQEAYLDAESVYHSFAETYYLTVTDAQKELLTETFFPDEDPKEWDFGTVTTQIRQVLRTMQYTTAPADWNGSDYVRSFLKDSGRGNAVAFASAAVLAYRLAGYPARYVEGYHISAADAEAAEDGSELTLTTNQAHAWAEVYVNRVGWLPVEVVPGMYVENYTNQKMEGRPAYKVRSGKKEDAPVAGTEEGKVAENKSERGIFGRLDIKAGIGQVIDGLLLVAYVLLLLYLLLEFQRFVRLRLAEKKRKQRLSEDAAGYYMDELERLLMIGGLKGDFSKPAELWAEMEQAFPGVRKDEQERAVELLEKAGFGGVRLQPNELHTLNCFRKHLQQTLYEKAGRLRKMWLRYVDVVKIIPSISGS